MNFQDIKTFIVGPDKLARPKNPYEAPKEGAARWVLFENAAQSHHYAVDESLTPGEYDASVFDEPVWQLLWPNNGWINSAKWCYAHYDYDFKKFADDEALNTRQFLPLTQHEKEQHGICQTIAPEPLKEGELSYWDRQRINTIGRGIVEPESPKFGEWVDVNDRLPENSKPVFALVTAINGNYIPIVANYTEGKDIEIDEDGDYPEGEAFLSKGWYECCEQSGGSYDTIYFKREVICWKSIVLPSPPKSK